MRAENDSSFLSLLRMPPTLLFWNPTLQSTWYLWYLRKLISLLVRAESQLPNRCIICHTLRGGEHTRTHTHKYTPSICRDIQSMYTVYANIHELVEKLASLYTRIVSVTWKDTHIVHTESHMHATITVKDIHYGNTHTHTHTHTIFLLRVRWNTRCLFADGWQH